MRLTYLNGLNKTYKPENKIELNLFQIYRDFLNCHFVVSNSARNKAQKTKTGEHRGGIKGIKKVTT